MAKTPLIVYLSGEIHSNWRQEIINGTARHALPIQFTSAVTDHSASDAAGDHLGKEPAQFWRDHKSAKVNAIRTRTLLQKSDVVIVRFGDQYKQWNAAFEAGYCAALGKPYITLHDESLIHPLKEIDAAALAWTKTTDEVIATLKYICLE